MAKLTDAFIRQKTKEVADSGERQEWADDNQHGLRLRIGLQKAMWVLVCKKPNGATGRFLIGEYPNVGLNDARAKARRLREQVRDGFDPVAQRKDIRAQHKQKMASMKLADLFPLYEEQGNQARSWPLERPKVEKLFNSLLSVSLMDLTTAHFRNLYDASKTKVYMAWGVRMVRPMFRWAADREFVKDELRHMQFKAPIGKRERYLTHSELQRVLVALKDQSLRDDIGHGYADCFQFLMLTLLRRSEAVNLKWADVDMRERVIRLPVTKNNHSHVLPLSRQAMALIESRDRVGDYVFCYEDGRQLTSWNHAQRKLHVASDTKGWHRHDLRRTDATLFGQLGVDPHVVEAALNHVTLHTSIHGVYNQSRYLPQVAVAMQRLADKLEEIETGEPVSNVVPFAAVA